MKRFSQLRRGFVRTSKRFLRGIDKGYFLARPEVFLTLSYAIARFRDAKLGFAVRADEKGNALPEGVYFTAKTVKEKKQIVIHLRLPVIDQQHGGLSDYLDADIYMPQEEVYKLKDLVEHPEKYLNK